MADSEWSLKLALRWLLCAIASVVWEVAVTIASQKGCFDDTPDLLVAALFFVPIMILAYLGITHEVSRQYYHRVKSHQVMSFFLFLIGGAALGVVAWLCFRLSNHQPPSAPTSEIKVPVYVRLQIDAVKDRDCEFRVLLKNGPTAIHNLKLRFDTDTYHKAETIGMLRDVAPDGSLSIPGSPMVLLANANNSLTVVAYYDATLGGVVKHFIARFDFSLRKEDLRQQVIDPDGSNYSDGLPPTPDDMLAEAEKWLKRQTGTYVFAADEVFEGKTNKFRIGDLDKRAFVFDAESMCVTFKTTTATGRAIIIRQYFKKKGSGRHVVRIGWTPKGGWVSVDEAKRKEDYDP